jgi:TRAP-type C4-dicarboxylate transport system permease small subunit
MARLASLYRGIVGIATLVVAGLLIAQVFFRYVLGSSLAWGEEVSTFLMIWAGLLGAATLAAQDRYIAFSAIKDSRRPWLRKASRTLASLAAIGFALLLVINGSRVSFLAEFSPRSSAAEIPLNWVYAVFPIAGLIVIGGALLRLLHIWRGRDE